MEFESTPLAHVLVNSSMPVATSWKKKALMLYAGTVFTSKTNFRLSAFCDSTFDKSVAFSNVMGFAFSIPLVIEMFRCWKFSAEAHSW